MPNQFEIQIEIPDYSDETMADALDLLMESELDSAVERVREMITPSRGPYETGLYRQQWHHYRVGPGDYELRNNAMDSRASRRVYAGYVRGRGTRRSSPPWWRTHAVPELEAAADHLVAEIEGGALDDPLLAEIFRGLGDG